VTTELVSFWRGPYTPSSVTRLRTAALACLPLAAALATGACGSSDEPDTPEEVLEAGGSIAQVVIGDATFDFEVTCYDAGAGSVVVVGTGTEPAESSGSDRTTHVLVQAFLGESYVGVTIGDNEALYEAALDETLDLLLEQDVIAADDIEFVRNLDLTDGESEGEPAGVGSLRVTCGGYEHGVPPQFDR
jgi:hypothetical protein